MDGWVGRTGSEERASGVALGFSTPKTGPSHHIRPPQLPLPPNVSPHTQVEKAPLESYADVGGLEQQVQEIKEAVELPLTHPELYEDIGIKPPKVSEVSHTSLHTQSVCSHRLC